MFSPLLDWSKFKFRGLMQSFFPCHMYALKISVNWSSFWDTLISKMLGELMGRKGRQCIGKISWPLWKAQTLCWLPLISQKQRAPTRSGCPWVPTMDFRSARTKVCSADKELRGKNLNSSVGNVHTDDAVSACNQPEKGGEGYVLKLENSWGKKCKVNLQTSLFHVAPWSYRFSGLYIILMHLVMTTHMVFNNQIKNPCQRKSYLKAY